MKLIIEVEFADPSDYDWLRDRLIGAVEEKIADAEEEGRMDGKVEVSWDVKDDEGE